MAVDMTIGTPSNRLKTIKLLYEHGMAFGTADAETGRNRAMRDKVLKDMDFSELQHAEIAALALLTAIEDRQDAITTRKKGRSQRV